MSEFYSINTGNNTTTNTSNNTSKSDLNLSNKYSDNNNSNKYCEVTNDSDNSNNINNLNGNLNNNLNNLNENLNENYSSKTQANVTKFRIYGSNLTIFTVITTWRGYRSSVSMQYSDFHLLNESLKKELESDFSLLSKMPHFPEEVVFNSSFQILRNWDMEYGNKSKNIFNNISKNNSEDNSPGNVPQVLIDNPGEGSLNEENLLGILKKNILDKYMIAIAVLLDQTPYLRTLLNILEVLPPSSATGSQASVLVSVDRSVEAVQ